MLRPLDVCNFIFYFCWVYKIILTLYCARHSYLEPDILSGCFAIKLSFLMLWSAKENAVSALRHTQTVSKKSVCLSSVKWLLSFELKVKFWESFLCMAFLTLFIFTTVTINFHSVLCLLNGMMIFVRMSFRFFYECTNNAINWVTQPLK